MAKIEKASEDIVKLFDGIRDKTAIPHWIQFELFSNKKQKELYKINKTNDVTEVLSDGINFTVVVNEEIFDGLPDDMQEIAFVECLAGVNVSESDAVSLEKPDFVTHSGVMNKYGDDSVIRFKESVKSLFHEKKQREDEEKAMTKNKRKVMK
jgi:TRAP-type mannitol/chloroaromatic compound transport system substrate-binding protein